LCDNCETIADLVKDALLNDKADRIFECSITELCQKITLKEISQGCVKSVEESVDPLVVHLATDLESKAVCAVSDSDFSYHLEPSLFPFCRL
ncbi:uncharacterized protein DEA37_0008735, partial [Paragonimus westermani]